MSESIKERDERDVVKVEDRWAGQRDTKQPSIDINVIGFKLKLLSEYLNTFEGGTYLDWAHVFVKSEK